MDTAVAGRIGGNKTLQEKGKEHFIRISKLGVEARRKKGLLPIDKLSRA